jgi:hypothetical protein
MDDEIRSSEAWRPVAGFEDYYAVSAYGEVYSYRLGRRLKSHHDADGYRRVGLWDGVKQRKYAVHRLVANAFHGHLRNALHSEVAHLDGNPANCDAANLKWVSKVENRSHRKRHGTESSGERHGLAKLTELAVRHIRSTRESRVELAGRYGVSPWTIDDVRRRRNWKHVR